MFNAFNEMDFRVENQPCFLTNSLALNRQRKLKWKCKQLLLPGSLKSQLTDAAVNPAATTRGQQIVTKQKAKAVQRGLCGGGTAVACDSVSQLFETKGM